MTDTKINKPAQRLLATIGPVFRQALHHFTAVRAQPYSGIDVNPDSGDSTHGLWHKEVLRMTVGGAATVGLGRATKYLFFTANSGAVGCKNNAVSRPSLLKRALQSVMYRPLNGPAVGNKNALSLN